jgi:hypothetical protein
VVLICILYKKNTASFYSLSYVSLDCLVVEFDCRGLGNPEAVRELRSIVKQEGPALLFIMETKVRAKRVENLL